MRLSGPSTRNECVLGGGGRCRIGAALRCKLGAALPCARMAAPIRLGAGRMEVGEGPFGGELTDPWRERVGLPEALMGGREA